MSEKKEIIVPKWVAGFLIVLGTMGILGIANSTPPATATTAKVLPSYCADGYHDNIVECGWTPERQRQREVAEQQRAYDESGAWSSDNKYSAWRCDETPSSKMSYGELQNCARLLSWRR